MMDYAYHLILLSLLAAFVTSLAALSLTASMHRTAGGTARLWLLASAATMGSAVWMIHFAGLLLLSPHPPTGYEPEYLVVSWLIMIAASCLALRIASRSQIMPALFISDATLISLGISSMYYTSMYALRVDANNIYSPSLFSLFVSILITLASLVLLAYVWLRAQSRRRALSPATEAAVLLPMMLIGWHYLATTTTASTLGALYTSLAGNNAALFAMLIAVGAIALILLALIVSMRDGRADGQSSSWNPSLKNSHNELSRMALLDTLTQLPNRRLFQQHLEIAIGRTNRMSNSLAVAFIDLDEFKPINDALGHHIGDEVLLAVAKRLNAAVRGCDVVARIGGDEFVALIEEIKSDQDIVPIVERIVQSLRDVFYIDGHEIAISASVGIAVYPRDGNIERLMVCADAAMYRAKSDGKNRFRFFDAEIELASDRLQEMQRDLGQALEKDEFKLHFQPKIDSKTHALVGMEALLRWQHPTKGMIAPGVFIPAAERFGLINAIGEWVIEESCRIIHRLRSQGTALQIAINLSPQQFRNPQLVNNTLLILQRFDLPPSVLMFEVSEISDQHNQEQINALLGAFSAAGIEVAIGNFGAGISSLSYLQNINARELKLDRTFISDIGKDKRARAVVGAIIRLAHALKFRVVAEGVETEDQRKILAELGCDQQQGYLFARPVPEEKLVCLIRQLEAIAPDVEQNPPA